MCSNIQCHKSFTMILYSANSEMVWKTRKWKQQRESESFISHHSLVRGRLYQNDPIKDKQFSHYIKAEIRLGCGTSLRCYRLWLKSSQASACVFVPNKGHYSLSAITTHPDIFFIYIYIKRTQSAACNQYINLNTSLDFRPWRACLIRKNFKESLTLGTKLILLKKLLHCDWTFLLEGQDLLLLLFYCSMCVLSISIVSVKCEMGLTAAGGAV